MDITKFYPLRLDPIYQYRLWGGRGLSHLISKPLPDGPIGEAWILSDRKDHQSRVYNGPLKGKTIGNLLEKFPEELLGNKAQHIHRFPLLLKFLYVRDILSVQVHPSDEYTELLPEDETGKNEAWVVLEADNKSRIYAGLKKGTTADKLRQALDNETVEDCLSSITPKPGDGIFIPAGTVHALGCNIMVFEVQQNSDVTFRLYDWGHIDPKTGKTRELQVEKALKCIDFSQVALKPVGSKQESTVPIIRERLFNNEHFCMWRLKGESPFIVGAKAELSILVCIEGSGQLECEGINYSVGKGDVFLIPAIVGACDFIPNVSVNLFEIALPEFNLEVKDK